MCDKNTTQCEITMSPNNAAPGFRLPDCCRGNLMSMLFLMPEVLKGFTWWLDFGTLLGFTRDGRIIDHDDDIDIGLLASEMTPEALREIKFRATKQGLFYDDEIPHLLRLKWSATNHLHVDLWLWTEENGIMKNAACEGQEFSKGYLNTLMSTFYMGSSFYIPQKTEIFLEERYPDWKTPRSKGDGWHPMYGKEKK